jgi:uncharacterized SAM-binding protein YcdF (DUF218 family)
LLLGIALWGFTNKRKKLGRGLVVTGTALLLVFGYPWLSRYALLHLERQYPALVEDTGVGFENRKQKAEDRNLLGAEGGGRGLVVSGQSSVDGGAHYIMVLGMGLSADTNRPPAARFSDEALQRIIEGVRLHRWLTNSTLLISVAGPAVSKQDKEQVLGELLLVLGMGTNAAQVCAEARDTEDEIAWCQRLAGTNRVLLVSSASHLPRAMLLARHYRLDAIAAPSGYLVDMVTQSPWTPNRLFPSSISLYSTERAMNEYLGLAWEKMRGGRKMEDGRRRTED